MTWIRRSINRLRAILRSESIREDIANELRAHVEMAVRTNLERGMSPKAARAAAAKAFGDIGRAQDMAYDVRGGGLAEILWQDLRFSTRILMKDPGFTGTALLTVALGVGANTAIFSVVNSVLLRPLPYPNPDQLVMVWESSPKLGFPHNHASPANFLDWRSENDVFAEIAAFAPTAVSLTGSDEPERLEGARVSAGLFALLGVPALLGQTFTPEEDAANAGGVVVLSYGLWQRLFGADRRLIGRSLTLNEQSYVVIGVMPPAFQFPDADQEFWMPMAFGPEEAAGRGDHYLTVAARLKADVSMEQAQREMSAIAARLEQRFPQTNTGQGVALVPLHEQLVADLRKPLLILFGVVGFVLLIACVNVANLLMARATSRQKEFTIRRALGASSPRLTRQLLTESVLLALLGGLAGAALAIWGAGFVGAFIPGRLPWTQHIVVDGWVLAFSLALSLLSGILFGLLPAVQASKLDLAEQLKEGGHANVGERSKTGLQSGLVVAEIGLAFILLAGAGLMVSSLHRLISVDPGFQSENVLALRMHLSGGKYRDPDKRRQLYEETLQRVRSQAGVEAAAVITERPLGGEGLAFSFAREGLPPMPLASLPMSVFRVVSGDYFRVMRIPLLRGRSFTLDDKPGSTPVAVVNESMAQQIWPGEDALGKRFKIGGSDSTNPWLTIIGIVGSVRQTRLDQQIRPETYVSYAQDTRFFAIPRDLVVRTTNAPLTMTASVREQIREVDADLPVFRVQSMEQVVESSTADKRITAMLLGMFAALAMALAVVGIFGLMSYTAAQRTGEIKIRMALGAGPGDILRLLWGRGLMLTGAGIMAGLAGALALTRVMTGLLFGVSPTDPWTFGAIGMVLASVSLAACYVPARRILNRMR